MTGKIFPEDNLKRSLEGGSELDLVRSGLEDTMRNTYNVISEVWNSEKNVVSLRTAAMIVALKRVAQSYSSLGL